MNIDLVELQRISDNLNDIKIYSQSKLEELHERYEVSGVLTIPEIDKKPFDIRLVAHWRLSFHKSRKIVTGLQHSIIQSVLDMNNSETLEQYNTLKGIYDTSKIMLDFNQLALDKLDNIEAELAAQNKLSTPEYLSARGHYDARVEIHTMSCNRIHGIISKYQPT